MKRALGLVGGWMGVVACSVSPVDYPTDKPKGSSPPVTLSADASIDPSAACATPEAATDPLTYAPCSCAQGGAARCVPSAAIPAGMASQLSACNAGACIPESIIRGETPKTCESPFGEGRCVSLCIPAVAEKASLLDRGKGNACAADERCAPCSNPLENGASTGVCEMASAVKSAPPATQCADSPAPNGTTATTNASDASAAPPAKVFTTCCEGHGKCVPKDLVPASARDALDDDDETCVEDAELCVPEELIDPTKKAAPCRASVPFVGDYEGTCVSDCFDTFVPSGDCPGDLVCAPKQ